MCGLPLTQTGSNGNTQSNPVGALAGIASPGRRTRKFLPEVGSARRPLWKATMCGIAGVLTLNRGLDARALAERLAKAQTARGPDALCVEAWHAGGTSAALAHNRLSIIDLSAEANQPMLDSEGRRAIVFNGEIYNYIELKAELEAKGSVFRTRSDTEVLLEALRVWGDEALDRLYGMFAFAVLDSATGAITLVRDRFGVKPLYFRFDGRTLAFASTPGELARWGGLRPSLSYVARGLRLKYYEDESAVAPFEGLEALEAGHVLHVSAEGQTLTLVRRRWYDLGARTAARAGTLAGLSADEADARLLELLDSACAIRLRSDVPLGVSLSGGVDSTTIAATVRPKLARLAGFSFADPADTESEGPLVARFAADKALDMHYVRVTSAGDARTLFDATLDAQQAPFPHASMMAQFAVFRTARAAGFKVLLGGQAGDEAFMGYRKFFMFYAQSILRGRRFGEMGHLALSVLPFAFAVAKRATVFWRERARYSGGVEGMGTRLALPADRSASAPAMLAGQTPRDRQTLDVTRFSLPSLLRYEDRNSAGNSIESRLPFIDHRIVEFGLALPERAKLAKGFGKWILRRAIKDRVPDYIRLNRDKRGFDVNQTILIDLGLGAHLRERLQAVRSGINDLLPPGGTIEDLFSDAALRDHPQAFKEAVSLIWYASYA
jgi:asparagine synthase (glutamine-hydrolysing)